MPTFIFLKDGEIVEKFTGVNKMKLQSTVEKACYWDCMMHGWYMNIGVFLVLPVDCSSSGFFSFFVNGYYMCLWCVYLNCFSLLIRHVWWLIWVHSPSWILSTIQYIVERASILSSWSKPTDQRRNSNQISWFLIYSSNITGSLCHGLSFTFKNHV